MFGGPSTSKKAADDNESDSDEENGEAGNGSKEPDPPTTADDEFNFSEYDKEQSEPALKMSDVVEVTQDEQIADNENDSDADDDIIKPSDNLVLVGRVESDCSSLEVSLDSFIHWALI